MHLYKFDEVDSGLKLLPMAARRALDAAGIKLSLHRWLALPLSQRETLTQLGSETAVSVARVTQLLEGLTDLERFAPPSEPPSNRTPEHIVAAFGEARPIPDATWSALTPLDRFSLNKVSIRGRPNRLQAAYQELIGHSATSTHLDPAGGARMVSVSAKPHSLRTALACSEIRMSEQAFARLLAGDNPKGDVLATARIAGIMAAKKTADLVPLCHPLALTKVAVTLEKQTESRSVTVEARVEAFDRTGVEMEALTAASVAALTVYDMLKAFDRAMAIGPTRLLEKSGGRSGDYRA